MVLCRNRMCFATLRMQRLCCGNNAERFSLTGFNLSLCGNRMVYFIL